MHTDRETVEKRIRRELWGRVLPLVHVGQRPLAIEAGSRLGQLEPTGVGEPWGAPWATTYFRFSGTIPDSWVGRRVEAVVDLGFHPDAAGFQCEGQVIDLAPDGSLIPLQGIHPRRTNYAVAAVEGPFELFVEAASNPMFPQFRPSPMGDPATAGEHSLYRLRRAELVVVDSAAEALAHDIDVLDGIMRALPLDAPRRAHIRVALVAALDRLPDVGRSRAVLEPLLTRVPASLPASRPGAAEGNSSQHHVFAVGHAHIDTAWLWPTREARRKCARTFSSAVALMDDHPEFRFVASSARHYTWIEEDHPSLFEEISERVARGQWIPVGGMWVEADMNLPSGESLARQIVFGQRYFEGRFGRRCTEVWIPDVFGYPAGLPQLFVAGGMTRFVTQKLSWNKQNRFPHSTFHWEGLDGTSVLTHFPPVDTYNADLTAGEVAHSISNFRDHEWSANSLMPFGYGDGGGGPTREMLERARRLASADIGTSLEIGSPAEFFTRVEQEAARGAPVPVWRGELYFETHRGTLTSQLRTKVGNRLCERLLVEAELWAASLGRQAAVDHLWKAVLTQQFHDILPGSSIAWVHAEAEAVFADVAAELEARIARSLDELAQSKPSIANPCDSPIDGIEVVDATALPDAAGPLLAHTQALADGRLAMRVVVPPMGVVPLVPLPCDDAVTTTESSMINRHLAVRWDAAGNLTSIIDLRHAREIVPAGSLLAVLELAPDHPVEYDAWDLESWTRRAARPLTAAVPADGHVEVGVEATGPLVGRVRVERSFGPSSSVVTYELRADSRQLLIHVEFDWQHDEHLLSMAFPVDVRTDVAACDVQFGVVRRPTHASSPWDAAKFEVCAHRFVDFSEPDFGVAILNGGRYGHSVFDGAIRVSLARAARYPDPAADRGQHSVTLAVRVHDADLGDVRAAASLLNTPSRLVSPEPRGALAAALADPSATASSHVPLVTICGSMGEHENGVEVDAVKLADDGTGDVVVRLHEACGRRIGISLRTPGRISAAWLCDLLEEPMTGEEVGDGIVSLSLRPFQLVTLRLQTSTESDGRSLGRPASW